MNNIKMSDIKTKQLLCPGCDQPIELLGNDCSTCGLEFRTMSYFIEEALRIGEDVSRNILKPVSARIGEYLVENKVLTPRQLDDALQVQHNQMTQGKRNQLGHILVKSGIIDRQTFEYYLALHALQLKLQLIFAYMNHAIDSDRSQVIPEPINQMKENLLTFVTTFKNIVNNPN